jgi:hypothetical protein
LSSILPNTFMNCAASMSWYTDAPGDGTDAAAPPIAPATAAATLEATVPATTTATTDEEELC